MDTGLPWPETLGSLRKEVGRGQRAGVLGMQ